MMLRVITEFIVEFVTVYLEDIIIGSNIVCEERNYAHPRHLHKIAEVESLATHKQLQAFIGPANWFSDYILFFMQTAAPLTNLLSPKPTCWLYVQKDDASLHSEGAVLNPSEKKCKKLTIHYSSGEQERA
ncbi:hypothetical protein PR048_013681 [Dryococelus australis]|uniref:Uncharacterized protein n=1 Tax=Dryococelus australis TaxID=614101 RepID=A0ABQ9HTP5_9NEOP|nr:hypothetical protein PR048_013681 [Dryococelus australis]